MKPGSMQSLGGGVDIAINDIGCQHMARVRVRIAEKIGEGDGGEGIVVVEIVLEELHCFHDNSIPGRQDLDGMIPNRVKLDDGWKNAISEFPRHRVEERCCEFEKRRVLFSHGLFPLPVHFPLISTISLQRLGHGTLVRMG